MVVPLAQPSARDQPTVSRTKKPSRCSRAARPDASGSGSPGVQTWRPPGSLHTKLVPRAELAAATRLDMVSVNVARAASPALAGVVIARSGVPPVFAITATAAAVLTPMLPAWRRPRVTRGEREPFLPAVVAGGRCVGHEPVVRRTLLRFATFMPPARVAAPATDRKPAARTRPRRLRAALSSGLLTAAD